MILGKRLLSRKPKIQMSMRQILQHFVVRFTDSGSVPIILKRSMSVKTIIMNIIQRIPLWNP